MRREILFEMKSPYRDDFRIDGFWFGQGQPTMAIVGAMRGDEVQQQFICSQMVSQLRLFEQRGELAFDLSVLVIPSCNPFSMNVSRRFWAMDGTDINRMFPGYERGETTQRIAAALFSQLQHFTYGVQMASFYMPGEFVPHIRMFHTGYEDVQVARLFGLPFVTLREPLPFDTALLNYNWQVWGTKAFSLYAGLTSRVDSTNSQMAIDSILRFLKRIGVIKRRVQNAGYDSVCFHEEELVSISAPRAGFYVLLIGAGAHVAPGDVLARILDPYDGSVLSEIVSPVRGTVFFAHSNPLVLQNTLIYRIQSFDD